MQYGNVKCWACDNRSPYPSDGNFYLCSDSCRAMYEEKSVHLEHGYVMNRHERRAAKKMGKNFH